MSVRTTADDTKDQCYRLSEIMRDEFTCLKSENSERLNISKFQGPRKVIGNRFG